MKIKMNDLLDEVSPYLFKYLRIIRKSKKFEKELKNFPDLKKAGASKYDYAGFMERFFIPNNGRNKVLVVYFILNQGGLPGPYSIQECSIASKDRVVNISVNRPSIVIKVYGDLTNDQWAEIKKQYEANVVKLKKEGIKLISFKDFRSEAEGKRLKGWDDIDLMLEIYKRVVNDGKNYPTIEKELLKIFRSIGEANVRKGFNAEDIGKKFRKLDGLIKKL